MKNDPFDVEQFRRRVEATLWPGTSRVPLPSPEDVVIAKLLWRKRAGRWQDADDAKGVLAVQGHENLDWPYIESWCDRHGTRDLLARLRQETRHDMENLE